MVARRWVRFDVWLRGGNGGGGKEAEWVMLSIKYAKTECVPDCRKCKKCK